MYSFPHPESPSAPSIRVPVLATKTILLSQINSESEGSDSLRNVIAASDITSVPALLQSWLFLGLASEALGRKVEHHEFSEPGCGGSRVIDIRISRWFFTELCDRWVKLKRDHLPNDFEEARRELNKQFDDVSLILLVWDALRSCDDAHDEEDNTNDLDMVLLSIHMLMFLVGDVLGFKTFLTHHHMASTKLLIKRLADTGWCSKRLNIFTSIRTSYPCLFFLSSITPPQAQRHISCTPRSCAVSTDLLPPLHRTPECLCTNIQPSLTDVNRILKADGIPLIRVSQSHTRDFRLEVVPYRRGVEFTAISHVWADRQLGSTQNCLPRCQLQHLYSLLGKLPQTRFWQWRHWSPWKRLTSGEIEPPDHSDKLFWLDTFCIPQEAIHKDLKERAIQSMNFIYAVATDTLVLDSELQQVDVGQRPSSLFHGGTPTHFAPQDDKLLDCIAHIFASTWMGRAWTLQEGMMSASTIFQFQGSQAHIKLLMSDRDGSFSDFRLRDFFGVTFIRRLMFWETVENTNIPYYQERDPKLTPFHARIQQVMYKLLKQSLDMHDLENYARGTLARNVKFVTAHKLLQSRSTSQAADVPLILVNLSSLNGNSLARIKDADERMRSLIYGLGRVPIELLFFDCQRIGGPLTPDRWIPKGVSPGVFDECHTLQLEPDGFKLQYGSGSGPPELLVLPKSCARKTTFLVSCARRSGLETSLYVVETLSSANGEANIEHVGWCILLDKGLRRRGAQFLITRMHDKAVYLLYDRPLKLTKKSSEALSDDDKVNLGEVYHATSVAIGTEIFIERSKAPKLLGVARPQTPRQYANLLDALIGILIQLLQVIQSYLTFDYLDKWCNHSKCFMICHTILLYTEARWCEKALYSLVHRAWTATYQPDWDPNGPWKWFWKAMNYEPPVPFKTMVKWYCGWLVSIAVVTGQYAMLVGMSFYWLLVFPPGELVRHIILCLMLKPVWGKFFS